MLFITIFSIVLICFIGCIVIVRDRAIRAHKELKGTLISLSNQYNGTFKDTGSLEGMSLEINSKKFNVVCKTIIEGRRKYTNSYSLLISLIDNRIKVIRFQKKMRIDDAIHQEQLMALINSMLIEQ